MSKSGSIASAAILTVACAGVIDAQDSSAVPLDTVIVSAAKGPAAVTPLVQAVTVITGAELRAAGIQRAADALRLVPGATLAASGAVGSVTSLFLRGGESRYTRILIDGVPVNAVGGYFDFSDLTTFNVDRVEVVRGPVGVVHGADAMTGVVNLVTRRGSATPEALLDFRGGTYGTMDASVSASGGAGRARYSLGVARNSTDGILPFNNEFRNSTGSGSVQFAPSPATAVSVVSRYGTSRYQYPTDFAGFVEDSNSFRDQRRFAASLDASHQLRGDVQLRILAGTSDATDITDDIEPPPPWEEGTADVHSRFRNHTSRRIAEARATWFGSSVAALTVGTEYSREKERSVTSEGPAGSPLAAVSSFSGTRNTTSAFVELSGSRGLEYVLGARTDNPSDFGTFNTWRAGLARRFGPLRVRGNAGTAINAPAFSQLLPTEWTVGSPSLESERALSFEFGAGWAVAGGRLHLDGARFRQRFRDLIQYVGGTAPDFRGSYDNLAVARSDGWELEARAILVPGLTLTASRTWLHARVDRVDDQYEGSLEPGQPLLRRPRHATTAVLTYVPEGRASVSLGVRDVGRRADLDFRDFPSPMVELPRYAVTDIGGAVRLNGDTASGLWLTLRVENVFDREYQEVLYYGAPGRTILLGGRMLWSSR
jgi:vitamin B12 transporter